MILHGVGIFDTIVNFEYLRENETKFENILTHWSVAQAGSNDEKNGGQKYPWTVSLSITNFTLKMFFDATCCCNSTKPVDVYVN